MKNNLLAEAVDFDTLNQELQKLGFKPGLKTPGDIISALLPYVFVIAGLILFALLIMGGFGYLTSGGDPESVKKAQGKLTSALVGFLIIFLAYWLTQLLEIIFGISIFG